MRIRSYCVRRLLCFVGIVTAVHHFAAGLASAEVVPVDSGIDNTLFQFNPLAYSASDQKTWLRSNGSGNFFSAGQTNDRAQIQRGLIRFDLAPAIPAGAIVDDVSLRLYVLDVPAQAPLSSPDFWLIALPKLTQLWGEGDSTANLPGSGAGSGKNATLNDATWYHTQYDPILHYHSADVPPWSYDGAQSGFWPDTTLVTPAGLSFSGGEGALGDSPVSTRSDGSVDRLIDDPDYAAAGVDLDNNMGFVTWSTEQMRADVQNWLDDPTANFGWIVVGIEDQSSSKRGFASFENTGSLDGMNYRPTLFVDYHLAAVPEPSAFVLCLVGAAGLAIACWRRR